MVEFAQGQGYFISKETPLIMGQHSARIPSLLTKAQAFDIFKTIK
jgi:hypothetical protein